MTPTPLFDSFFIGGFECSTHTLGNGRRLDLLAATGHTRYASQDFKRLRQQQLYTIRSGVRWHLLETAPYQYDFSTLIPYLRAIKAHKMQVIWDLCHYGYPADLDIFSAEFVRRFAKFARAVARVIVDETDGAPAPIFCPVNEPSFWAWAAGDAGYLNPFVHGRSFELKQQLIRATIEATEAIWDAAPGARLAAVDPLIHIAAPVEHPDWAGDAEGHRQAQFQSWDMLSGRLCPELGGQPEYLDLVGVNFYPNNQWIHGRMGHIYPDHPQYRPLADMLTEVHQRYQRPIFIAETGAEGDQRAPWLRSIVDQALAALKAGVPLTGICLYPIIDYPGWDDERHCPTGLWGYADASGDRPIDHALARELRESRQRVAAALGTHVRPSAPASRPAPRHFGGYSGSSSYQVMHEFI